MAAVSFKITRNDIAPALSKLAASAKNPEKVLRAMGTTFMSITMGNFNDAGSEYRPAVWAPKRDGSPSNLQKSTTLARSFHLEVTNVYARVSNPVIYAAIHQFGGIIVPKSGKYLRFKWSGGWATVKSVKIPARPFFPVLNGQLTEKAEEKIRKAGERQLARESQG